MQKLGAILKAVGRGAVIAAGFTPAGSAAAAGLRIGGAMLNGMDLNGDDTDNLHEVAVQSVLDHLPVVIGLYDRSKVNMGLDAYLAFTTDQVHRWLQAEAMRYAVAGAPAPPGQP